MKLLLTIFFFAALGVRAGEARLAWDASPDVEVVTGYKVYWGVASRDYTNSVDVATNLTATVTVVSGVNYYFAATAYDVDGWESDFSNEVAYPPLPPPSINLITPSMTVLGNMTQ